MCLAKGLLDDVEMTLRESTPRTRLEVLLKADGGDLGPEFDRHEDRPGSVLLGMTGPRGYLATRPTAVVQLEAILHIRSDSYVMSRRICVTTQDVDKSFRNHSRCERTLRAVRLRWALGSLAASRDNLRPQEQRRGLPSRSRERSERLAKVGSSGWIRTSNPPVNSRMLCR
jgi:hypothetical protein